MNVLRITSLKILECLHSAGPVIDAIRQAVGCKSHLASLPERKPISIWNWKATVMQLIV